MKASAGSRECVERGQDLGDEAVVMTNDIPKLKNPFSASANPSLREVLSTYETLLAKNKLALISSDVFRQERADRERRLDELEVRAIARVKELSNRK